MSDVIYTMFQRIITPIIYPELPKSRGVVQVVSAAKVYHAIRHVNDKAVADRDYALIPRNFVTGRGRAYRGFKKWLWLNGVRDKKGVKPVIGGGSLFRELDPPIEIPLTEPVIITPSLEDEGERKSRWAYDFDCDDYAFFYCGYMRLLHHRSVMKATKAQSIGFGICWIAGVDHAINFGLEQVPPDRLEIWLVESQTGEDVTEEHGKKGIYSMYFAYV